MKLKGKNIIVTGASSGMGMAAAKALSDMGGKVVMLCRDQGRGMKAFNALKEIPGRDLEIMFCDLGDYSSIRDFASEYKERFGRLDILVNNAGFISLDRQETREGLEKQFGTNHIGHFLLVNELLDVIPAGGRIVVVSSGAHKAGKIHFDDINLTKGYNVVKAYSQSKLATVLYTRELAERLKDRGITVNCCHPGAVATNMGINRETGFGKTVVGMLKPFFLTPEDGAKTAVYLASSDEVKDITGQYFYKCQIAKSSKRSKDMILAKKLYELSEEIIGVAGK